MKKKIGSTEYEIVTAETVKSDGRMVMSDGKRASCNVGLKGPHAKVGDEYAVVGGTYVPVSTVEKREAESAVKSSKENGAGAPPTTLAADKKALAAAKRKEKAESKKAAENK